MRPNNRAGAKGVKELQFLLSDRDMQILDLVRAHRLITTRQLQRLLFHEHTTSGAGTRACNRVLTRLRERRFLERLARPVGGVRGGSGSFVWMLGPAGDRVTRPEGRSSRIRPLEPTLLFLAHTLAIAETRVLLTEASRTGSYELTSVTTEPSNWRTFPHTSGASQIVKPDLQVVTAVGDYEDHWFIEIDQGTESIPTVIRKCLIYERYRRSGAEQRLVGVFPLVVWITSDARRRRRMAEAISDEARVDARLFRVVAPDELVGLVTSR